jgi:hypothetical protein
MEKEKAAEVETETTPVVPEEQQPVESEEKIEEKTEEPVDDKGVPVKNRLAEANRKLRKAQAQEELLDPNNDTEKAIKVVRDLAQEEAKKMMEPILVKDFLRDNPDAIDMIEDINRIRTNNPELASVDKLDLAFKVAKAEKQDEIIRKRVELETKEKQETIERSNNASVEGTGKTKTPSINITDRIANATSLKELQEIESLIK